ncbi:unnamed protein product [Mucor hiemalis]
MGFPNKRAKISLDPDLKSAEKYRQLGDYQLNVMKNKQSAFDYYALGEKDWRDEYCRYKLALLHLEGVYAHPSINRVTEAIRLLRQNAKKGHWESCKQLAIIYCDEDYGEQDLDKALVWFNEAVDAASKTNTEGAGKICYSVGNLFREGVHFEQNYKQALVWYERAVELNHIDSLYFLALIHHDGGFGVQQNSDEALKYYISASYHEENCNYYAEATNALGDMHRYGEGVEMDYKEAFQWYQKSAQSENPVKECLLNLASMYSQGLGTEMDLELAEIWTGLAYEDE